MTKKEICEKYIEMKASIQKKEDALSEALMNFQADNMIIGIIPDDLSEFVDLMLYELVGDSNQDWVNYWIYECDCSETNISVNEVDYHVTSFDQLWDLVGEN